MSSQSSFRESLQIVHQAPNHFIWSPTADWYQGRGVYGGLVFAVISEVIKKNTQLPIRRLTIDLCAPVLAQETILSIRELRRGTNTQFLQIECLQEGKVVAAANATCGGARTSDLDCHHNQRLSITPPKDDAIPFHPSMPSFSRHFEYWPTWGSLPFSKASELKTGGWIRARNDRILDQAMICALIDSWWPALYLSVETPRPMGTISCSIDFTHPSLPISHPQPFRLENSCSEVRDGYSIEHNTLWSSQGTLLAMSQQSIVVIR